MRREELEAQIAADPYDDTAYSILADVLQLEGDPRGELIALDVAAMHANTEHRTWRQRRTELLARHPDLSPGSEDRLGWHLGFVRRVTQSDRGGGRLDPAMFAHPALLFATELVLQSYDGSQLAEFTAAMPCLRMLAIGDPDEIHWQPERTSLELDGCVDRIDRLESLFCARPVTFVHARGLRMLDLRGGDPAMLAWLVTAQLPALERVVIHFRTVRIPFPQPSRETPSIADVDDFKPLLATPPPRLTTLELVDVMCGDALVRELATSPLLRQLRTLRLWNAGITADGARHITREAFGHLELLDLSDPALDDATIAMVDGVCREVRTISPRMRDLLRR